MIHGAIERGAGGGAPGSITSCGTGIGCELASGVTGGGAPTSEGCETCVAASCCGNDGREDAGGTWSGIPIPAASKSPTGPVGAIAGSSHSSFASWMSSSDRRSAPVDVPLALLRPGWLAERGRWFVVGACSPGSGIGGADDDGPNEGVDDGERARPDTLLRAQLSSGCANFTIHSATPRAWTASRDLCAMRSRPSRNARALGIRRSGSRWSAARMIASSSCGHCGLRIDGGSTSASRMRRMVSKSVRAENSGDAVTSSHATTPIEKMSDTG